jgi:hypothetical protein
VTMLAFAHEEKTTRDARYAVSGRTHSLQSRDAADQAAERPLANSGHGLGFSFGNMSVFSPPRTRALNTAHHDEMIQPVGPARFTSSCACGGTCSKCRNPQGRTGSDKEGLTREGAEDHELDAKTKNGDAGGGAGGGAAGGGGTGGGTGGAAAPGGGAAAPKRSARLKTGPRYNPHGSLTPTVAGGRKKLSFAMSGVFDRDPAAGVFPECGEIHQDIKWNAAAATSMNTLFGNPVPHGGFPAAHPANVWIEDRDAADTRYGRRSGPQSAPVAGGGDEYTDAAGQNQAHGATYNGNDNPDMPAAFTGRWTFMVLAFDMCNHGVEVGPADFITIDW